MLLVWKVMLLEPIIFPEGVNQLLGGFKLIEPQKMDLLILNEQCSKTWLIVFICAMVKSRYIGDGHPTFNRNPYLQWV